MDSSNSKRIVDLHTAIRGLSVQNVVVFCAACAERLLPNYVQFSQHERWGSPNSLRTILDRCWEMLIEDVIDKSELADRILDVNRLTPHTEHFEFPFTGEAGDATNAIWCCLACLRDRNVEYGVEASQQCVATADHYIRTRAFLDGYQLSDEAVYSHSLWIRELATQEKLIELLRKSSSPSSADLQLIRQLSWNSGVSNVGLTWSGEVVH